MALAILNSEIYLPLLGSKVYATTRFYIFFSTLKNRRMGREWANPKLEFTKQKYKMVNPFTLLLIVWDL